MNFANDGHSWALPVGVVGNAITRAAWQGAPGHIT